MEPVSPASRPKKHIVSRLAPFLLIAVVGFIWYSVWQQFEKARRAAEEPDTPNSQLAGPNAPHGSVYANAQPATTEIVTPEFKALLVKLEKDLAGLEGDVDRCEQTRCQADPHLAKALKDFENTPFAGPHPRLASTVQLEARGLIPLLVEDYKTNARDSKELKAKLIGPIQSTLEDYWGGEAVEQMETIQELAANPLDPLIYYLRMLQGNPDDDGLQLTLEAYQSLGRRTCHPLLRAIICCKLSRMRNKLSIEQYVDAVMGATEAIADVFQKHQSNLAMLQFTFGLLSGLEVQLKGAGQIAVALELAKRQSPECPRWVVHYAASMVYSSMADHYRGTNFMSGVSKSQMTLFEEYADLETKHLLRAWTQAPVLPSLTTALMRIETRAGSTNRSADAWFRHVLSEQLDYSFALDVYTQHCRPRWGGSDEKLFWLAGKLAQCSDIEGDSDAPFYYWWPLNQYCIDHSYSASLADAAPLHATLKIVELLKKRIEATPHPRMSGPRTAMVIRVLWEAKLLSELRWFLDHYRGTIQSEDLAIHRLHLDLVDDVCHAAQGEGAGSWQTICEDLLVDSRGLTDDKLANLEVALEYAEELAVDQPSKRAARVSRRLLEWTQAFRRGDEVSLSFDEQAEGWLSSIPLKIIDSQTVEFECPANSISFFMTPMIRLDAPYHFKAVVQATIPGDDIYGLALQAGPHGSQDLETVGMELRFVPAIGLILWDSHPRNQGIQNAKRFQANPGMAHAMAIEIDDHVSRGLLGGQEVANRNGLLSSLGIVQLGRSARYLPPQPQADAPLGFRISNVKIKRLRPMSNDSNSSQPSSR